MKPLKKRRRLPLKILSAVILSAAALLFYSRFIEPNMLTAAVIAEESAQLGGVPPFRVVLFSDTHFGSFYPQENIEKIVKKINAASPDMVIFGGDFFDNYAKERSLFDLEYLQEQLSKIESAQGKFAVFGNHDHGGGAVRIYEKMMESGGFDVLKNESAVLNELNINLIGMDDYGLGRADPDLYSVDNDYLNIIASHQPDVIDEMSIGGEVLMLSGHSHGGQVSIPFITEMILPYGAKKYVRGRYNISDGVRLFVTKGIGTTGLPLRFLNPPEIAIIDIK